MAAIKIGWRGNTGTEDEYNDINCDEVYTIITEHFDDLRDDARQALVWLDSQEV